MVRFRIECRVFKISRLGSLEKPWNLVGLGFRVGT